jgi:hypothetical protein
MPCRRLIPYHLTTVRLVQGWPPTAKITTIHDTFCVPVHLRGFLEGEKRMFTFSNSIFTRFQRNVNRRWPRALRFMVTLMSQEKKVVEKERTEDGGG